MQAGTKGRGAEVNKNKRDEDDPWRLQAIAAGSLKKSLWSYANEGQAMSLAVR